MGMEILAVVSQVLVVRIVRHGDERAHVGDTHGDQALLERIVQLAAQPAVAYIARQVNRRLDRPVIRLAAIERAHIGITHRAPVEFHYQIRITPERALDTPGKLLNARHLVFAGDHRLEHIRLIDSQQRRRVIGRRQANRRFGHLGHTAPPIKMQGLPRAASQRKAAPSSYGPTG